MKIIKAGKVIPFVCGSCGCEFYAGVNAVDSNDGNYYANCPMCDAECHTDIADIQKKEKQEGRHED